MEEATKKFKEISEAYEVLSDGEYCVLYVWVLVFVIRRLVVLCNSRQIRFKCFLFYARNKKC